MKNPLKIFSMSAITLIGNLAIFSTSADAYNFTLIADTTGEFNLFQDNPVSINDSGMVAFRGILDNGQDGIYIGDGSTITTIADRSGQFGSFEFGAPAINNNGVVVFKASLDNGRQGIFTSNGMTTTTINNISGPLSAVGGYPDINNNGLVSFQEGIINGIVGIYKGNGGSLTTITDNTGILSGFAGEASINDSGTVAFWALLDAGFEGIFAGNGSGLMTTIVDRSDNVIARNPSNINNSGMVGFTGDQLLNNPTSRTGVYTSNGSTIIPYFNIPSAIDPTLSVVGGKMSLNDNGLMAYEASLGFNSTVCPIPLQSGCKGIFTGDDPINNRVITTGDQLLGSTVTNLQLWRNSLNNNGQIAFYASLADGRQLIVRAEDGNINPNPSVPEPNFVLGLLMLAMGLGWQIYRKHF